MLCFSGILSYITCKSNGQNQATGVSSLEGSLFSMKQKWVLENQLKQNEALSLGSALMDSNLAGIIE